MVKKYIYKKWKKKHTFGWVFTACSVLERLLAWPKLTDFYMVLQSWQISVISLFHFGWDQNFPIPFNCQQVPLLHVTVSNVLKVMGKWKGWFSLRWCEWTSPQHSLCWGKFINLENLLFTLCECLFAENKWSILIHQLLANV